VGGDVSEDRLRAVGGAFAIEGAFQGAEGFGSGHIHDTFLASWVQGGRTIRYVHQRLNTRVFRDPVRLMENFARVTAHLHGALRRRGIEDPRRALVLVPARDGHPFHVDDEGRFWRTLHAVPGARSHDTVHSPAQAFEAARAFGEFVALLADLPPPPLHETIPDFHDTPKRVVALEDAVRADPLGRARSVLREVETARRLLRELEAALAGAGAEALPRRVVHNDCKINNVLLDDRTGEGICVIDLDTVMTGTVLCDFGDLVRTAACPSPEDETRLDAMRIDLALFDALARGYLAGAAGLFDAAEIRSLALAGPLLAFENAVRFLTDHLAGDVYFRIHREAHNRDRARAQLRLTELFLEGLPALRQRIEAAARPGQPG
jgi:Ser/Thr protein kinase RdoA (MazF antagonist)